MVTIGFTGSAWIAPFNSRWNVSTTFSLATRSDIGRINSSPRAITFPVIRLQEGCNHTIFLAVSDPDDDVIRCRWAKGSECGGICDGFPGAILNSDLCGLTFVANRGTGFNVVALMIEDFIPDSLKLLSSVAYQFLVLVVASDEACSAKPHFINPTVPNGECISIPPGGTFTTQLVAYSGSASNSITEIQTVSPSGTQRGQLQQIPGTSNYFVNITWTPQANQQKQIHQFCYVALNSAGVASQQSCIELAAGYLPPEPKAGNAVFETSNVTISIIFDTCIERPPTPASFVFHEFFSSNEIYKINTTSSAEIDYANMSVTLTPKYSFATGQMYYISIDSGIVQGTDGCKMGNEPLMDKNFWTFSITGNYCTVCRYTMIMLQA